MTKEISISIETSFENENDEKEFKNLLDKLCRDFMFEAKYIEFN